MCCKVNEKILSMKNGLIVSCQITDDKGFYDPENPIYGPEMMALIARAAVNGGAVGIRVNGPKDTQAVKKAVNVPIIGINKTDIPGYDVRITPTFNTAREVILSGADIVAIDATLRARPEGITSSELIKKIKKNFNVLVMADISTLEEAIKAEKAGADFVATTLSSYTSYTRNRKKPDFELVQKIFQTIKIPVICEGGISTPLEAKEALKYGAYAVTVGAMIVNVKRIVEAYNKKMK